MATRAGVFTAVVMAALVQCLAGCTNEGAGVAPPGAMTQPAGNRRETQWTRKPSIADREGWSPDGFFTSPNELQICQLISSGDKARLAALLDSGVELNTPGKFGLTILYWAYVEDDLEAFKLLLEHGADPDYRLTNTFRWSHNGPVESSKEPELRYFVKFWEGNSIFFTSLRQSRSQYCFAALKYSKNVNQLDRGENLLHRFLDPWTAYKEGLQELIDAGVDLNAKGRFGCTPSHLALSCSSPTLCLQLLEAGADPSIKNDEGFDVAEELERTLLQLRSRKTGDSYASLIDWFEANYRKIQWTKPKP